LLTFSTTVAIGVCRNLARVTKPFDLGQVQVSIDGALRYQALVASKRFYEQSLEETVRLRTAELRSLK
jgi:ribosome biogenesis SPOUT family RNA methylase Rps3